ncbi:hypothetical protein SCLCIDRAFT_923950 [Scleroderma citrinum Foug A]|uniref:Uncharacterized protein n=1 Tax=Scleroderma citrinum Foug A TaxID=1036808 RepID=A0A0C3A7S1_9AGAM|nr:hypothetical protein SCLCIDRAFT_923950 [Scleroderma citrinum Foug A]
MNAMMLLLLSESFVPTSHLSFSNMICFWAIFIWCAFQTCVQVYIPTRSPSYRVTS